MNIEIFPVTIEAYESLNDSPLFIIKNFDQKTFELEIKTLVNSENWDEISTKVKAAILYMEQGL
jgi:hypothetical protein